MTRVDNLPLSAARDADGAEEIMRAHYQELDLDFAEVIYPQATSSQS